MIFLEKPLPITVLTTKLSQRHITVQWKYPKARENVAKLGDKFQYRTDIDFFTIEYKETNNASTNQEINSFGLLVDGKPFSREHIIRNLKTDLDYSIRIRSTDRGNQESPWSEWIQVKLGKKKLTLCENRML